MIAALEKAARKKIPIVAIKVARESMTPRLPSKYDATLSTILARGIEGRYPVTRSSLSTQGVRLSACCAQSPLGVLHLALGGYPMKRRDLLALTVSVPVLLRGQAT